MQPRTLLIIFSMVLMLLVGCTTASPDTSTAAPQATQSDADQLRGAVINPPRSLSDFALMSTTGEPFSFSDHQGEILLIYFGYRACPDFCPTTFAELKQVYKELDEPNDKLKILFVTLDPERDTLENLTLYTQAFHDDFIGLRDDGEALQQLMKEFGVVAERRQLGDSSLSYLIDHTASVFLVGTDGRLQAQYLYGTDYRDIVHDVRILMPQS